MVKEGAPWATGQRDTTQTGCGVRRLVGVTLEEQSIIKGQLQAQTLEVPGVGRRDIEAHS